MTINSNFSNDLTGLFGRISGGLHLTMKIVHWLAISASRYHRQTPL